MFLVTASTVLVLDPGLGLCAKNSCYRNRNKPKLLHTLINFKTVKEKTSGYATWFTAGDAIRITHYDVIDDVITLKL